MLVNKLKLFGQISRQIFIYFIIVTILGLIYGIWHSSQQADFLPLTEQSSTIEAKYSYFISRDSVNTQEVLAHEFSYVDAQDIPFQLDDMTYWIKVELTNKVSAELPLVLHADNAMLEDFSIYQLAQEYNKAVKITLDTNTTQTIFPHLSFNLPAKVTNTYLMKIKTLGPPNVPIVLYHQDNFQQRIQLSQLLFGAFIGIMLMIAAYNVVVYFALKDNIYLIYLGYQLSAFVVLAGINGFGYYLLPVSIQQHLNDQIIFFHYLLAIFLLVFTLYFLRYNQQHPKITRIVGIVSIALIITSVISTQLSPIMQAKVFFSVQPMLYLLAIFLVGLKLRKSFAWARFYFISWLPLLIGAAVQPMLLLNFIDYSFIAKNAFLLGVLIEVSFMAFALAERMRRNEQERLHDVYYHANNGLLKKVLLSNAIAEHAQQHQVNLSILVIKPEHIDHINLYMNDRLNSHFYRELNRSLSSLFAYNNAIVPLSANGEKLCLVEKNTFAILIDNKKTTQSHQVLIQSIQSVILDNYKIDQLSLPLSAHVGIANFPEHGNTSNQVLNRAQLALKQAENSPNKWAIFEAESALQDEYLLKLACDLQAAINNNEFEVYHQPQIDLKTLRVCGSECLLRWHHHSEGEISPDIFIAVAEDTGLINELTLWAFNKALSQHQDIIDNGNSNHMLSINISAKDISSKTFYQSVIESIEQSEIRADKIIFELTEAAIITDNEQAQRAIEQFSELGITISIDDFGSGCSSLSYITDLPFNELKIDRQFVADINQSRKRKTIVQTMATMAKGIGLEVVAEGISSEADEKAMQAFGCDIGQGYYYAPPMPIMSYLIWLKEQVNGRNQQQEGEFISAKKVEELKSDGQQ
ncbi:EAL domain-containing protein [Thalassotalea sp. PLHSN55]|uniref:EAL domain-containing protein n=1 Tax=Thalassotalea sp. PLHSN55 TaxID=3435888 RepID=UPI003F84717F